MFSKTDSGTKLGLLCGQNLEFIKIKTNKKTTKVCSVTM